jgi:hypothetical protein
MTSLRSTDLQNPGKFGPCLEIGGFESLIHRHLFCDFCGIILHAAVLPIFPQVTPAAH